LNLLIDSNSYLRIARNIHPLLGQSLGPLEYKLFIHSKFFSEFNKNDRLATKFNWVNTLPFTGNRDNFQIQTQVEYHQRKKINNAYLAIKSYKKRNKLSTSEADMIALATAYVLNISIITDDPDMLITAEEFGIKCIRTIEFLSYLHANNLIDDSKLLEMFDYWEYDDDPPKGYHSDRKKYFPHLR
jgi:predicted nucleic acid-binding protein